jgi:hypothetical protein
MNELTLAVVHLEPCLAFEGDNEAPDEVCHDCGWLVDEHVDIIPTRAAA